MKISNNNTSFGALKFNVDASPVEKLARHASNIVYKDEYQKLTNIIKKSDKTVVLSDSYDRFITGQIQGDKKMAQGDVMNVLRYLADKLTDVQDTVVKLPRKRF